MLRSRLMATGIVLVMTAAGALHWWTSPRAFVVEARLRVPHNLAVEGVAAGLDSTQQLSASILDATCAALKQQNIYDKHADVAALLRPRYRFSVQPAEEQDEVLLTYTSPASETDSALLTVQATLEAWCKSLGNSTDPVAEDQVNSRLVAAIAAKRTEIADLSRPTDGIPADDAGRATLLEDVQSAQTALAEARVDCDEAERMRQLVQQAADGQTSFEIAAGKLTDPTLRAAALALVRWGELEESWKKSHLKLADFEKIYGSQHPRMLELQRVIADLREEFGDNLPNAVAPVANRMVSITADHLSKRKQLVSQLTTRLAKASSRQQRSADQLQKQQAATAELFDLERQHTEVAAKQLQAQSGLQRAEILAAPVLLPEPVSPLLWQELGLGFACGLVIAGLFSIRRTSPGLAPIRNQAIERQRPLTASSRSVRLPNAKVA